MPFILGLLGILKGISALERNPPNSRTQLTLQRLQGLSMIIYYPLEYVAFFSSPFAPIIPSRIVSPAQSAKVQLWSIRSWGIYVLLQVWICANELGELSWKEGALKKALNEKSKELQNVEGEKEKVEGDLEKVWKRRTQVQLQLVANASRLPVILHWSVTSCPHQQCRSPSDALKSLRSLVGGFYKNEVCQRILLPEPLC